MATIQDKMKNQGGTIFLHEILKEVSKLKTDAERVKLLNQYAARDVKSRDAITRFIEATYHPKVVWLLPKGIPAYRPLDAADETLALTTLHKELKKVALFMECPTKIKDQVKRERSFIMLLEALAPNEAKLLIMMKDRAIDNKVYPNINENLFRLAFPHILPDVEPEADPQV